MTEPKSFSIAVLKGSSRGRVVRTDKKRIAVGSAQDNDLVLQDPEVLARHFVVLVDQGRWRIHAMGPDKKVTIGSDWVHPTSGERGALVSAAGVEILLCPGVLDEKVIEDELSKRTGAAPVAPGAPRLLEVGGLRSIGPTQSLAVDLLEPSQMPTIALDRPPEDLRQAAKARLQEARGFEAPSVTRERAVRVPDAPTVLDGKGREEPIDLARPEQEPKIVAPPRSDGPRSELPEVVPEPEAQPNVRNAERVGSEVTTTPAFELKRMERELEAAALAAPSQDIGPNGSARNAWGDRVDRFTGQMPRPTPVGLVNAWGDAGPRRPRPEPSERPAERQAVLVSRSTSPESPRGGMVSVPTLDRGPALGLPIDIESLSQRVEPALSILREPDGEFATAIRLLGTRVEEFMRTLGYRAYMLTSPEPLTGKSTIASNLALALAEDTHRRVALIEANFRHPRLAHIYGAPPGHGLIPLLEGRAQVGDAAVKVTERNLVIIPSGGKHPSPAELLASPRFKALVAELAHTVDIAIIDAPSVTPFADANLLLPLVDAALLVIAEGRTKVGWMTKARGQIGDSRILGAVYNRIPKAKEKVLRREVKIRMKQ